MGKIMRYLAGFVMIAFLLPLRQDANAGVSEWMKTTWENHPQKAWTYYKDQSFLEFWAYNTHYNWTNTYYYRKDFKPHYTVDQKNYTLNWYTPTRWGPQYSSNLAYAKFSMSYFPKQKYYASSWGDQHEKEAYDAYLTTYWKIVSRWALGVHLRTNRSRIMYDKDYMESVRYYDYRASSDGVRTYNTKIDDEDYFNSTGSRGYAHYNNTDTQYYKVGLGLKWIGKSHYGLTCSKYYGRSCTAGGAYPDRPEVEAPE